MAAITATTTFGQLYSDTATNPLGSTESVSALRVT
jgi:hypothetical protein